MFKSEILNETKYNYKESYQKSKWNAEKRAMTAELIVLDDLVKLLKEMRIFYFIILRAGNF